MMPSFFRFNTAILLRAARAIQHWAEGTVALLESRGEKTGNKSQEKSDGERGSSISSDAAIADSDGAVFPREPAGPPAHWVELVRRHAPELLRPVEANEPELRERAARPEPPILGRGDRLARPTAQDEISEISPAHRPGRVKRSVPQRPAPETPPPAMSEVSDAALESFSGEAETKEKSARAPASAGREPAPPEEPSRAPSPSFLPSREPADRTKPRRAPARPGPETPQRVPRSLPGRETPPPAMSEVSDAALESFSGEAETKEKSARAPASAGREPAPPEEPSRAPSPSFLPSREPADRTKPRRAPARPGPETPQRVPRSLPGRETPPPAMSEVSDAALESFSGEAETKEKSARAPASAGREPAPPERKPHAPSFLPSHRPTDRSHARRPSPRSDQESVQRQPRKVMARALPTAKAIRAAAIDFSGSQRDLPGRLDQGRPRGGKLRSDSVAVGRRERP